MRRYFWLCCLFLLTGCYAMAPDFVEPERPENWMHHKEALKQEKPELLQAWWKRFDDPVLTQLVSMSLNDSPDRLAAEARILEARGVRRTSWSALFPQIGASGEAGRQDSGFGGNGAVDDFYDAGFDASFELDLFGQNKARYSASEAQLEAIEASYHDTSLTLIADVVRAYIDFRASEKQAAIAQKNLDSQQKTLDLVRELFNAGAAPKLDVDRSENLVNTTKASIPEFKRQAENARLRLSVLTGALPQKLAPILEKEGDIPGGDVLPVLYAPADVLRLRPDVRAASATLLANSELAEAATGEFFPNFTVSGFYGISDGSFVSNATVWNVAVGAAVALLDFGRIEGQIDAARARELEAFQLYRKSILQAVTEVETALSDYAYIQEQYVSLEKAYKSADSALGLSQNLFKEGAISFLDVLDAQRSVNSAESAMISARAAKAESLARLFKSLGVY